jgi:hypothetical protein
MRPARLLSTVAELRSRWRLSKSTLPFGATQRIQEIATRLALGEDASDVLALTTWQPAPPVLLGLAAFFGCGRTDVSADWPLLWRALT